MAAKLNQDLKGMVSRRDGAIEDGYFLLFRESPRLVLLVVLDCAVQQEKSSSELEDVRHVIHERNFRTRPTHATG